MTEFLFFIFPEASHKSDVAWSVYHERDGEIVFCAARSGVEGVYLPAARRIEL